MLEQSYTAADFLLSLRHSFIRLFCSAVVYLCSIFCLAAEAFAESSSAKINWRRVEPGYSISQYNIPGSTGVLRSQILLLKFSPKFFSFKLTQALAVGAERSDIRTMTMNAEGIAGINAHFFDVKGRALGLLIADGKMKNKMHKGGRLLNGVFQIGEKKAEIKLRKNFTNPQVDLALQSGPILILGGNPQELKRAHIARRRSGVAVTKEGEIIIFATVLPFPGATFSQVQNMLLTPSLGVRAALNLDGGSSSQLYIRKNAVLLDDTFITGGENVPVGLIVLPKKENKQQ